ncbi:hypothetical protein [Vibrio splendidus]|uniref:hypothetical protein n=1 Tax=Vibrio splendidus TaxID=29497 RepID=UPI0003711717|nr:hypothetical protein [Vibrio splendidus]OED78100.1 hypothetical protein A144_22685 [Vibrio splendidus ZF-90]OEF21224.1 hypothetical protein A145_05805 [Vibrio splendidus 5S-101]PTO62860.1 hypothetical protein CWN81_23830 [Vibrio splendidus]PTP28187.1 hypothetical protein CWN95_22865 [Vibrio splendidus]
MKILFFDPHSLIYSNAYLSRHDKVREAFKSQKPFSTSDLFLKHVEPDRAGAQKLARAATEAGILLYPTGDHYTRELLIKHNVFTDNQLAPYKNVMLRPDDNDPYRRMFAHAQALEVDEWYVCGEMALDERLKSFPGRNLVSTFGEGVSDDLISQIRALHHQH